MAIAQESISVQLIMKILSTCQRNQTETLILLLSALISRISQKKNQISQFNNVSVLYAACGEIIATDFALAIYKGTGDGFIVGLPSLNIANALLFCEKLISNYLKHIEFITYRIGINYGLFFSYLDLNGRKDFFGQSVIDVSRIADFGDNNHILLSEKAAKNLIASNDLRKNNLKELGFCFDKHRKPYKVYNYISELVGAEFME